ncbi:hypothetical protein [Mycobacterium sp. PSTR-4-N]|uniref:hypothetical protein n=1 Tax=Mycobacterium sp. PSTR-4-N TaxID=2917745 RepID=UPI001F153D85|nr:hypothetical protein [Mycobacterium sp. PSTR-4-N]MCG7596344.1 hypothetical protein [Mycobacterium sp. PSTR-4-N]
MTAPQDRITEFVEWLRTQDIGQGEGVWLVTGMDNALSRDQVAELAERFKAEHPQKVWVVLASSDEGDDRYLSSVYDSEDKANAYVDRGWGMDAEEAEVQ